jgi:hypothetical protein
MNTRREQYDKAMSEIENALRQQRRCERENRRVQRQWLRQHGLTEIRAMSVYRVETQAIDTPEWAEKYAIPEFSREPDVIWVKQRGTAKLIARYDKEAGGTPRVDECEARRCPYCTRWMIGFEAAEQRKRELAVRLSLGKLKLPPCNFICESIEPHAHPQDLRKRLDRQ